MELDQLRHFVKVAELGNFTRAAETCYLSQPALSRSIARLEEELGQPLFERQTRQTTLTDAGQLLLSRVRQILAMVDDVQSELCDDGKTGKVRVAAIPTIAPYYLPALLQQFQEQCPAATIVVQEDTTDILLKKIADGAVDIGIAALPLDIKYLKVEPLFEEELLLVMSSAHPLNTRKSLRVADIEALPFVLLGEAHCLTESVLSFCRQRAFHPVSVEKTSQLAMVQELVSLNHGVSLVPQMASQRDHHPSRIYRSLAGTKPMRTIAMVTNEYRFQTRLQRKFQDLLKADAAHRSSQTR